LISRLDPLKDPRWPRFLERHPLASVFHSVPWLCALQETYGYDPAVFTTSPENKELTDGVAVCSVLSWATGSRMVSLPFSDHCDPLVGDSQTLTRIVAAIQSYLRDRRWRYLEVRPLHGLDCGDSFFQSGEAYVHHQLDLAPGLDSLFARFHKDSVQRKIYRAERERVRCEEGASEAFLRAFYSLFVLTRRRHNIPPQPLAWFRNLIASFNKALQIRVAFKDDQPVAAILTIRYKSTLTYKYGCSDSQQNRFGGTQMLFWKAIEEAKRMGLLWFDLGRSEAKHVGLVTFKDRWGAARSNLIYMRSYTGGTTPAGRTMALDGWKLQLAKEVFARSPDKLLCLMGNLFYKHVG